MKKKSVALTIALIIFIILIMLIYKYSKSQKEQAYQIGEMLYEKIHNLYLYGEGIKYKTDEKNNNNILIEENKVYYEIYEKKSFEMIAEENYNSLLELFNVKKNNGKTYIEDFGRGMSNYYGTRLKLTQLSKKRMEFKASTKLCYKNKIIIYADGCEEDGYYEIDKPFVLVKEDGLWKVSEYTSIFQFSDRELK